MKFPIIEGNTLSRHHMLTDNYPSITSGLSPFELLANGTPKKSPKHTITRHCQHYLPSRHHKLESKNTEKYSWYSTGSLTSTRRICILPGERSSIKANYDPQATITKTPSHNKMHLQVLLPAESSCQSKKLLITFSSKLYLSIYLFSLCAV